MPVHPKYHYLLGLEWEGRITPCCLACDQPRRLSLQWQTLLPGHNQLSAPHALHRALAVLEHLSVPVAHEKVEGQLPSH